MRRSVPPDSRARFYTEEDLLDVLMEVANEQSGARPIVFMLGAGFSAPAEGRAGVPMTSGVISRLRERLSPAQRDELAARLRISRNQYQDAFDFIRGVEGVVLFFVKLIGEGFQ